MAAKTSAWHIYLAIGVTKDALQFALLHPIALVLMELSGSFPY